MIALQRSVLPRPAEDGWQAGFLALLPEIRKQVSFTLRHLSGEARENVEAEAIAAACVAYRRLWQLGRSDVAYAAPLARFALAHYRAGRRVGSRSSATEVLSVPNQTRAGFAVQSLYKPRRRRATWTELLVEDKRSSPAELAAWRIDLRAWLATLSPRDQAILRQLAVGERTINVARQFGLSPGRISQLRANFFRSWSRFLSD